jgi:hypothetical protein
MPDDSETLMERECRAVRRLARLFRIERSGRFERLPGEVSRRLRARRGELIKEVQQLETRRRSFEPWTLPQLDVAMGTLAREADEAERYCLERLALLGAELDRRRGRGSATGLRDGAGGRILGRG